MAKNWYVIQAYSGFEKNVQKNLKERIAREGLEELFGQILVPVEEVVGIKNGRKTVSERKFFPGYVLIEMEMTDESWHLVKSTPRVNGFVGGTANKSSVGFFEKIDPKTYLPALYAWEKTPFRPSETKQSGIP